ncbi:MAG: sporulation protein [Lachnospiraceae bacterium]|nr:sporulation protein [Lachnospiraceae bacterium]
MAENNFLGVIDSLMKGMNTILSTKTVVGDPMKLSDDTVIVPLVDISFGVGAGANAGDKKNGGAGGFSGKLTPSAVLVIKNGSTKLVNIKNQDTMTKVLDMIPDIVDKLTTPKEEMIDDEEAVEIAFPEEDVKDVQ